MEIVAVVIAAALGLAVLVMMAARRRIPASAEEEAAWRDVMMRLGGRWLERQGLTRVVFRWQGREAELRRRSRILELEIPGTGLFDRYFRLAADLKPAAGCPDSGDVEGLPPWKFQADRGDDVRRFLTEPARRLLREGDVSELSAGPESFRIVYATRSAAKLTELALQGLQLAMHAKHAFAGGTGVRVVSVEMPSTGDCQVCGAALQGTIVECAACATPHHADCWAYAGACSTYACGSRESRRR